MSAPAPPTLGTVLAGGLGSRFGGDKAGASLAGKPLISFPLRALEAAGLETVVVAKAGARLPPLTVPIVNEATEPRHPLHGIVTGLGHAEKTGAAAIVAVACDMPLVPAPLLAWLAGLEDPLALPLVDGHPQPLLARYGTGLLPALRAALHERPGALTAIVARLRPRLIGEAELARFGDPHRMLHNVNTPADLRQASGRLPG